MGLPEPEEERKPWVELAEVDDFDQDGMDYNGYVTAKVMIPKDGHTFASGVVKRRARDETGELIGKSHSTSEGPFNGTFEIWGKAAQKLG